MSHQGWTESGDEDNGDGDEYEFSDGELTPEFAWLSQPDGLDQDDHEQACDGPPGAAGPAEGLGGNNGRPDASTERAAGDENAGKDNEDKDEKLMYRLGLAATKAGLEKSNKAKVNAVILEMSRGSAFFQNEERKGALNAAKVAKLQAQVAHVRAHCGDELRGRAESVARQIAGLEAERVLSETVVHFDMDAFFASVEELDNPQLRQRPMAVGGTHMLSTANYEARKFGVRSAMPGYIALKLCPDLLIVPPHYDRYKELSKEVQAVLREYDPDMCPIGLDESYISLTRFMRENNLHDPECVTREIRDRIFQATKLTASAGIAPNRLLAKICSDMNKPNGQYFLAGDHAAVRKFIEPLPIRKISGVGRVTEHMLQALGVGTCGDVVRNAPILSLVLSEKSFRFLLRASLGISSAFVDEFMGPRKSVSAERTFAATADRAAWAATLDRVVAQAARELQRKGLRARQLTVKVKTAAFHVHQTGRTLPRYVDAYDAILPLASAQLDDAARALVAQAQAQAQAGNANNPTAAAATNAASVALRLIGVRLSALAKVGELAENGIQRFLVPKPEKVESSGSKASEAAHRVDEQAHGGPSSSPSEGTACPVCGIFKFPPDASNTEVNAHVDECLTVHALGKRARSPGGGATGDSSSDEIQMVRSTTSSPMPRDPAEPHDAARAKRRKNLRGGGARGGAAASTKQGRNLRDYFG